MRLQPRREILGIWREIARYSFRDGAFIWAGSPEAGDSVSDAEQLLCLLHPATELRALVLDLPDETDDEALEALRPIGDRISVPRRLVRAMTEYMTRYSDDDGPIFPAGRYLRSADHSLSTLDTLESFAIGVRLSLAAMGFCRVLRPSLRRQDLIAETQRLEELASVRLTCAMVGLLRCYAVHGFRDDSPHGENFRRTIAQEQRAEAAVLDELERVLRTVRAGLYEMTIGMRDVPSEHVTRDLRFECGWSWAVIAGTPPVEVDNLGAPGRAGLAAALPHPYFSALAVDVLEALYSERTRVLGLLDEEQQRLARALQIRYTVSRAYWAQVATFGALPWPLDRMPWRTTSGEESDHNSLAVAAMTIAEFGDRRGNTDIAFSHLTRALARLARRHGIVRPPRADGAPGLASLANHPIPLPFEETGRAATYEATGLVPLLFQAAVRAWMATQHEQLRDDLEDLADLVWDHIAGDGDARAAGLRRFGDDIEPNWHDVLAVVRGLTLAMAFAELGAGRAESPLGFVHQLLAAAEELADTLAPDGAVVGSRLDRARRLVDDHPARAAALLYQVLAELDAIAVAREDAAARRPA